MRVALPGCAAVGADLARPLLSKQRRPSITPRRHTSHLLAHQFRHPVNLPPTSLRSLLRRRPTPPTPPPSPPPLPPLRASRPTSTPTGSTTSPIRSSPCLRPLSSSVTAWRGTRFEWRTGRWRRGSGGLRVGVGGGRMKEIEGIETTTTERTRIWKEAGRKGPVGGRRRRRHRHRCGRRRGPKRPTQRRNPTTTRVTSTRGRDEGGREPCVQPPIRTIRASSPRLLPIPPRPTTTTRHGFDRARPDDPYRGKDGQQQHSGINSERFDIPGGWEEAARKRGSLEDEVGRV